MKSHPLIVAVVVILALGALLALLIQKPKTETLVIDTFEECAEFYPVMESFPRQCQTPDGRFFVEEVEEAPEAPATTAGIPDLVSVENPTIGERITSPLTVTGSARGTWYFEASFPIEVRDAEGNLIGQGYGEAQGEWMTEDFVIFKSIPITFAAQPAGSTGMVILRKDNPSGLPEHDRSLEVPVTF